jgi:translocation and assembly module TamB
MKTRKSILWIVAIIPPLLIIGGLVAVHTKAFRRFLLAKIIEQAQTSTGARIEIRNMGLQWSPLTADFYGIVVHGKEKSDEAPLAVANHLRVSLGMRALLHKKVDLFAIVLDRPVLHVRSDAEGRTNLPQPPTKSSSNLNVLVRYLAITDGTVHYNDEQTPLSAELRDFHAQVSYNLGAAIYRGSVGYERGWIVAKDFNRLEHRAQAEFEASTEGMVLDRLVVATPKSNFKLQAKIVDFSNPSVEGSYQGLISTPEFARVLKNPSLPKGDIALKGTLAVHSAANQPFLKQLQIEGGLDCKTLAVRANQTAMALSSVQGSYRLQDGNLAVKRLDADVLGGHLTATAEMSHLDAKTSPTRITAALRGVSLDRVSAAVPANMRENVVLRGRVRADLQAGWSSSVEDAKAHARVVITGPASAAAQGNEIPVNGNLAVDYDGRNQSVSFGQSEIRTGKTEVTLNGVLSRNSSLNVQANVPDLHELSELAMTVMAAGLDPNAPPPANYEVFGAATFAGQVSGAMRNPRMQGQLNASDLTVQGSKWRTIRANVEASPAGARLQNVYAQTAQGGEITLDAQAGLQQWSFTPESSLFARGTVKNVSVGELELLAKVDYPVSGKLSGEFNLQGSEREPKGQGSLQLVNAVAWNEPIHTFVLQFHGTDQSVESTLQVRVAAGTANAKVTYFPKTQKYQANLEAPNIELDRLRSLQQRKGSVSGTLSASVSGEGTVNDPQLSAKVDARELLVGGQKFSDIDAKLDLAHQHATVQVTSGVAQASVQVKGDVDLKGEYPANATLDVRSLPLGPLMAMYQPAMAQDFRGQTEIHGSLHGPLKDLARVEARLEIPTLQVQYKTLQASNDGPWKMSYRNDVATIEQFRMKGNGTQLSAQGTIPLKGTAAMNVAAKGTLDMALLQMVSADVHSSGRIDFNVASRGRVGEPSMQGQVRIVNTSLAAEAMPVALSGINGEIDVAGNRVNVKEIKATAGGGMISTHGSFTYGKEPNFAMDVEAKSVRIHPNGLRSVLDGNVQLNGTPQKSTLSGQVLIDRLSFQDGFDLGTFLAQVSNEQQVSTPSPFESNMRLNVSVQSTQNLALASSTLSMEGSAHLNVTGTAANPVILGRVNLTGGEVFFLSKRFEVQSGTIAFANPVQTEPVVNLYVKTMVKQYNITIHFAGPATQLKTSYTSDPALPELDIINLLAFGQTTAEQASNPATPASVGAESAVAQQAAGQVASHLQQATGLSQLTIDPLAGTSQDPGAQVAIQQRLTGSILLTFSTDVTSTQRETVQIEYQPQKKLKYSVVRDEYGGYGFDVRYHKVF